jgi:hypothetical protein
MRKALVGMLALLPLAGCFGTGENVEVHFTKVVATDYANGRAGSCQVLGRVVNGTKYHLDALTFDLDKTRVSIGTLEANAHIDEAVLTTIAPSPGTAPFENCAAVARFVQKNGPNALALGCAMTGVAEGDCQKMVTFASEIDDAAIKKVAGDEAAALAAEAARLRAEAAPLARAARSLAHPDDTALLDLIVLADSQFWAVNRYQQGSMHDVVQESETGGVRVLRGAYSFNENQQGWVRVTLYPDWSQLPCVEFWDFAGSCRPTRVKDDFSAPLPPAPSVPAAEAAPTAPDAPVMPAPDKSAAPDESDAGQAR